MFYCEDAHFLLIQYHYWNMVDMSLGGVQDDAFLWGRLLAYDVWNDLLSR